MQKKTMIDLGIIAGLVIALIFASLSLVKHKEFPRSRVAVKEGASLVGKTAGVEKSNHGIKIRRIKDDNFFVKISRVADVLPLDRDPFSFGGTGPRCSRDNLELTGILREGQQPTAVIGGGFYKAGDSTDQFTVVNIQGDKVILKDNVGQFELRLKS